MYGMPGTLRELRRFFPAHPCLLIHALVILLCSSHSDASGHTGTVVAAFRQPDFWACLPGSQCCAEVGVPHLDVVTEDVPVCPVLCSAVSRHHFLCDFLGVEQNRALLSLHSVPWLGGHVVEGVREPTLVEMSGRVLPLSSFPCGLAKTCTLGAFE